TRLQHRHPRGTLSDAPHDQPPYAGRTPPVSRVRLQDYLHAGLVADELVGADADGLLSECLIAYLRQISLGHDDTGGGGRSAVKGHEIWPGIFENKAHRERINDLDLANA